MTTLKKMKKICIGECFQKIQECLIKQAKIHLDRFWNKLDILSYNKMSMNNGYKVIFASNQKIIKE